MPVVVDAYFVISEAFKRWRINDTHLTEDPKIAAITAFAIMSLQPFRAVNMNATRAVAEALSNELFALNCIAAIIGIPLNLDQPKQHDFWLRLMDVLSEIDSQSVERLRTDRGLNIKNSGHLYYQDIHSGDKNVLNYLICI